MVDFLAKCFTSEEIAKRHRNWDAWLAVQRGSTTVGQSFSSLLVCFLILLTLLRERSGSVVEALTRDLGTAGLCLTGATALWALSKTHLS